MEAKELRIGNYVNDHLGRIQKVSETRSDSYICYLSNGTKLKYKLNTTKPIPLTEEWLVKFGFEKYKDTFQFKIETIPYWSLGKEKQGCLKIYLTKTKKWKVGNLANKSIDIYSVHQLQNLYFALTDKELKINKL